VDQQINLFQPIFRKERKLLSFLALIQLGAVALVSLLAIYAFAWMQVVSLEDDLSMLSKQHTIHLAQLEQASRELSARDAEDTVPGEIKRLEAEIEAENYVLSVLSSDLQQQSEGFSSYLEGFSKQIVRGMWLTGFKVVNSGSSMFISGGALSPDLLPMFIQQLANEPALTGTQFNSLQILREEPQHSWIDFKLYAGEVEP
jgi:hypothetical protein